MTAMEPKFSVCNKEVDMHTSGQNLVEVTDRAGKSAKLQLYKGVYYNVFYDPKLLEKMNDFQMRDDDILINGFPRTGTHWSFEIVSMLLQGKAETIPDWKGNSHIEWAPQETLEQRPSPRLLMGHMALMDGPASLRKSKCRVVYLLRDPRDVALSYYKININGTITSGYDGKFEDFLYLFLEGKVDSNGYFEHIRSVDKLQEANTELQVHVLQFEESLSDRVGSIRKLSDFLGLPPNDELCQSIADKCTIDKMAKDKDNYTLKNHGKSVIWGKGTSGQWKGQFSDQMLQDYISAYKEAMAGSRLYRETYATP